MLDQTRKSTDNTCNPTSTDSSSRRSSTSVQGVHNKDRRRRIPLQGTPTAHLPLNLLYKNSIKFLGVNFDRHLPWSEHIQYMADRCKKRLNLMRAMAGSHWREASKETHLMGYRALSSTTAASPTRVP